MARALSFRMTAHGLPSLSANHQQRPKKEPKEKLPGATTHLRNLASKETIIFKNVSAFHFSDDSRFAAIEVNGKSPGKALIVRNLSNTTNTTFGNVTQHAWSDQGSHLAMVVDSPSISNSLQVFSPKTGILRTLESSDLEYKSLQWRKDSLDLAVMLEKAHAEKEDVSHTVIAWKGVAQKKPKKHVYDHTQDKNFSAEMFLPAGKISWSEDGTAIYCDLKEWENKPKALKPKAAEEPKKEEGEKEDPKKEPQPKKEEETKEEKAPEKKPQPKKREETKGKTLRDTLQDKSNVEVWHTKDTEIMPLQKKQASSQKNPSRKAMWWLGEKSIVQLGNELTEKNRDHPKRKSSDWNRPHPLTKRPRCLGLVCKTFTKLTPKLVSGSKFSKVSNMSYQQAPTVKPFSTCVTGNYGPAT